MKASRTLYTALSTCFAISYSDLPFSSFRHVAKPRHAIKAAASAEIARIISLARVIYSGIVSGWGVFSGVFKKDKISIMINIYGFRSHHCFPLAPLRVAAKRDNSCRIFTFPLFFILHPSSLILHPSDHPFLMQQFLNFFPLPHGQGSLRPTRCWRLRMGCGLWSVSVPSMAACCCEAISPAEEASS